MTQPDKVRETALRVLLRVFEQGAFLDLAADAALRRANLSERGRRFFTQIVYGTVRHKRLLDYVLSGLLHQPLAQLPAPIRTILRMGIFQALFCRQVTPPALVHTSVELAKRYGHRGTARLVNAVLRRCPRSVDEIALPHPETDRQRFLAIRYSVPDWILDLWIAEAGIDTAERLCIACSEAAPATLRVNTLRCSTQAFLNELSEAGLAVTKLTSVPEEVTLVQGSLPIRSKWFREGYCMMQDPAAMIGAHLLEPQAHEKILDICAAPGGKSTHIIQLTGGNVTVFAGDPHFSRVGLILENARRLGMSGIQSFCADGMCPPFAQGVFDRVLVDAPCSGLGTLRRHPDIKWRLTREDIERCAAKQVNLLRSAITLCKNGGVVVYGVCTFTRAETLDVIATVLNVEPVTLEDGPEWLDPWKINQGMYRTRPDRDNMDGFFWTRLRKRS